MKAIQKVIYTGFAAVAIASASMPVFPAHAAAARGAQWRGVDSHGYASAGRHAPAVAVTAPAARPVEREFEIRR